MVIEYRLFETSNDLDLQYEFWIEATRSLPYSWKATRSPTQFYKQKEFDPRSKTFAFEDDKLVGYMSFSGEGTFVSPGYPWCLEGYEFVRDELWNRVYGYASSDYGGTVFSQRFRESWKTQIDYFMSKGFELTTKYPMYIFDLQNQPVEVPNHDFTVRKEKFTPDAFYKILMKNTGYTEQQIAGTRQYFSVIDFDTSVQLYQGSDLIAYAATSNRQDNGFCELLALTHPTDDKLSLKVLLTELIQSLSNQNHLNLTTNEKNYKIPIVEELGFKNKENEVYVGLEIDTEIDSL